MTCSKDLIEKLRREASLVELIKEDTDLKEENGIWKGICPFASSRHSGGTDSDPSFVVYPVDSKTDYENFYCYGCHIGDKKQSGYGSDIFEYLRLKDGLTFHEAIEKVAKIAGIPLSKQESGIDKAYMEVLAQNRTYYRNLRSSKEAMEYLNSRGITNESIDYWRLGLVPEDAKFAPIVNRIAIPIIDMSGKACGFGFRSLGEESPKYINSPNSTIFKKSHLWYGLYQARRHILEKDCVIITEGYMDVIMLHQRGIENAVASMGTSINDLSTISKYTKNALVWLDSDTPGRQACDRYIHSLSENGFLVKIVDTRGDSRDPADVARLVEDLEGYIKDRTVLWTQYKINNILQSLKTQIFTAKMNALPKVMEVLDSIDNQPELDLYINWVSKELDVSPEALLVQLEKI